MSFFTNASPRFGRTRALIAFAAVILPLSAGSEDRDKHDQGDNTRLGTFVVVGDSLSAGFQNFSLYENGQTHGFAAVVADQAGATVPLPLISFPGIPPALTLTSQGQIVRAPGIGARENSTVQAHNLSVPGFTVADALAHPVPGDPTVNPIDALSDLILATPGTLVPGCGPIPSGSMLVVSEVVCASALAPKTILVSTRQQRFAGLTFGIPPTDPQPSQRNIISSC